MLLQPHSSAAQGSPVLTPSPVQCLHAASPSPQVAETCQLAVRRLEWLQEHGEEPGSSPYRSVDPAPPAEETDVATLRAVLLDESLPLFDRYRAMFALRNLGGRDAVLALADGKGWPGAVCSLWVCRGLIHDWISQIQSCVAACTAASRAACPPTLKALGALWCLTAPSPHCLCGVCQVVLVFPGSGELLPHPGGAAAIQPHSELWELFWRRASVCPKRKRGRALSVTLLVTLCSPREADGAL